MPVCFSYFLPTNLHLDQPTYIILHLELLSSSYILHYLFSSHSFPCLVLPCHVCGMVWCCMNQLCRGSCVKTSLSFLLVSLPFPSRIFCQSVFICLLSLPVTHQWLNDFLPICLSMSDCLSGYLIYRSFSRDVTAF